MMCYCPKLIYFRFILMQLSYHVIKQGSYSTLTGQHKCVTFLGNGKCKAIPLQAWTGPEGSRKMRLPDFKTIGT